MNVSIFQAVAALNAAERWQELVAQNLAASSIPGFKKQDLSVEATRAGLMPPTPLDRFGGYFALPHASTSTNFRAGAMRFTDVPTDLAIEGPGFFEVQMPNGGTAYTRDGELRKNTQGQLATKDGYLVLGDGGPIQLDPNNPAPVSVSATGEVSQGAELRGKLKLVDFKAPELLQQAGGGYYLATHPDSQPAAADQSSVRQRFLEEANVSGVLEMGNLIAAMRQFEVSNRVLQIHDERMGRTISELGNPT